MSLRDIYVEETRKRKERSRKIDYGGHYCSVCKKETKHRITYNDFRTVYTCMVCGEID